MKEDKNKIINIDNFKTSSKGKTIVWKENIGLDVKVLYDGEEYILKIIDTVYKNNKTSVIYEYEGKEYMSKTGDFLNCAFRKIFKVKFIEVIGKTNYEINYQKNYEEFGYTEQIINNLTSGSEFKLYIKCKTCGKTKTIPIRCADFTKNKSVVNCEFCGNTNSYAERLVSNFLKELKLNFSKKSFEWFKDKQYDFYIPSMSCIIETHGMQHYNDTTNFSTFGGRNLQEEQENDKLKEQLAKENGIEHYIVIDCRYSNPNFIRNNILNSRINELFNLNNINWERLFKKSEKSLVLTICDDWNNTPDEFKSTIEFAKKYNTNDVQIRRYLKRGDKIGLCVYNAKLLRKNAHSGKKIHSKYNYICNLNGEERIFYSISDMTSYYNASYKVIWNIIHSDESKKKSFYKLKHIIGLKIERIDL